MSGLDSDLSCLGVKFRTLDDVKIYELHDVGDIFVGVEESVIAGSEFDILSYGVTSSSVFLFYDPFLKVGALSINPRHDSVTDNPEYIDNVLKIFKGSVSGFLGDSFEVSNFKALVLGVGLQKYSGRSFFRGELGPEEYVEYVESAYSREGLDVVSVVGSKLVNQQQGVIKAYFHLDVNSGVLDVYEATVPRLTGLLKSFSVDFSGDKLCYVDSGAPLKVAWCL